MVRKAPKKQLVAILASRRTPSRHAGRNAEADTRGSLSPSYSYCIDARGEKRAALRGTESCRAGIGLPRGVGERAKICSCTGNKQVPSAPLRAGSSTRLRLAQDDNFWGR
jgi:hypothetical protein